MTCSKVARGSWRARRAPVARSVTRSSRSFWASRFHIRSTLRREPSGNRAHSRPPLRVLVPRHRRPLRHARPTSEMARLSADADGERTGPLNWWCRVPAGTRRPPGQRGAGLGFWCGAEELRTPYLLYAMQLRGRPHGAAQCCLVRRDVAPSDRELPGRKHSPVSLSDGPCGRERCCAALSGDPAFGVPGYVCGYVAGSTLATVRLTVQLLMTLPSVSAPRRLLGGRAPTRLWSRPSRRGLPAPRDRLSFIAIGRSGRDDLSERHKEIGRNLLSGTSAGEM